MDNEEKAKLIQAFNIERFLEWQSQFYEEMPEWVADEIKAKEQREWELWEKFTERIKKGLPKNGENEENELSEAAQSALDVHIKRQSQIELFQKMKMPVLDFGTFQVVKHTVENSIEIEIKELQGKASRGVSTPERIFAKRMDYAFELIDPNLLEWIADERPLLEKQGIEAISTLSEVGVCQWILKELQADGEKEQPALSPSNQTKPLQWKGQKNTLAAFFGELKRKGFIKGSTENIAEWIAAMFENVGKVKDIDKDVRNSNLPKRDADRIEEILSDLIDFDRKQEQN